MENREISIDDIPVIIEEFIVQKISEQNKNDIQEIILIFPKRGEIKVVNEVAGEICNLIDGKTSIREIVDHLYHVYQIPRSQIEEDVQAFLNQLANKKVIKINENKNKQ